MADVDLKTFKPESAGELVEGIAGHLLVVLGKSWTEARNEIATDLAEYAHVSFRTLWRLKAGEIDEKKADALLHIQELYLNQIFLNVEFWTYVIAQHALDAVTAVVKAAVKNWTGVDLNM